MPGARGIWVKGAKIGSIGVGVKKWVTYHGMSVNINTDLRFFSMINPCGMKGIEMTSLSSLLGRKIDMVEVKEKVLTHFNDQEFKLYAEEAACCG